MPDNHNPYRTPESDPQLDLEVPNEPRKRPFSLGQCLSDGTRVLRSSFGELLGSSLVIVALYLAYSVLLVVALIAFGVDPGDDAQMNEALPSLVILATSPFLAPPLMWGFTRYYLGLLDGRGRMGQLFEGFRHYGQAMGRLFFLGILLGAIYMALIFLFAMATYAGFAAFGTDLDAMDDQDVAEGIVALVIVVPIMFLYPRFLWSVAFAIEFDEGPIRALISSWGVARGRLFSSFGLFLVCALLPALGLMLCILPYFIAVPLSFVVFLSAYRQHAGRPDRATRGRPRA